MTKISKTMQYFLHRYKTFNLDDAVEAAVQELYPPYMKGFYDYYPIPIDIESIATSLGVQIYNVDNIYSDKHGTIFYEDNVYKLHVRNNMTESRKRMIIAHELGHLIFRDGKIHRINLIDKNEFHDEELICSRIGSTLLMPKGYIKELINLIYENSIKDSSSWFIFKQLTSSAKKFVTSIPALIVRLNYVNNQYEPNLIMFCSAFFKNRYKKNDPKLRIWSSNQLGSFRSFNTWYNKSIETIGLDSVCLLFDLWCKLYDKGIFEAGVFTLNKDMKIRNASKDTVNWIKQSIVLSKHEKSVWKDEEVSILTSSCLFSKKEWNKNQIFIVSIGKQQ